MSSDLSDSSEPTAVTRRASSKRGKRGAAGAVASTDDAPESGNEAEDPSDEIMEYERRRQENIRRNQQQLSELNITEMTVGHQLQQQRAQRRSSAIKRKIVAVVEPSRRSSRVAGLAAEPINYNDHTALKILETPVYQQPERKAGDIPLAELVSQWAYDTDDEGVAESRKMLQMLREMANLSVDGKSVMHRAAEAVKAEPAAESSATTSVSVKEEPEEQKEELKVKEEPAVKSEPSDDTPTRRSSGRRTSGRVKQEEKAVEDGNDADDTPKRSKPQLKKLSASTKAKSTTSSSSSSTKSQRETAAEMSNRSLPQNQNLATHSRQPQPTAADWLKGTKNLTMPRPSLKLCKKRVMTLNYHPTSSVDRSVLACTDRNGAISMYAYNEVQEQPLQIGHYDLHYGLPATEALWSTQQPYTLYSTSQHGDIRALDIYKEQSTDLHIHQEGETNLAITCMTLSNSGNTIMYGDKYGTIGIIDTRASAEENDALQIDGIHDKKIACMQFNPFDNTYLATGSNDRTMCVWDVRKLKKQSDKLYSFAHGMAVTGIQWSHTGKYLCTTSYDNQVKVWKASELQYSSQNASDYEIIQPSKWSNPLKISHNNHTGRWVTAFRPAWLHDDAGIVIGNMTRAMDVLLFDQNKASTDKKLKATTIDLQTPTCHELRSDFITSIPAVNAVHPRTMHIAGMTASGYLLIFQPKSVKLQKSDK